MSGEDGAWRAAARDWVTIWQSELAALADDREAGEMWQAAVDGWARLAEAAIAACPVGSGDLARRVDRAGADAAARPAPAAAAPDARDAELGRLAERVAELERLLAGRG